MQVERVTVFGGTGFLGRRIVERLAQRGLQVTVVSRSPSAAPEKMQWANVSLRQGDLRDAISIAAAVSGVDGVVNAVGHYVETRDATFEAIHVEGAEKLAGTCRQEGVQRLIHLSGIGADAAANSPYVRSRGLGEAAVQKAFEAICILRPSVMFAQDDAFLSTLLSLVKRAPVIPLFAHGETKLQPVFADDVAEAVARALTAAEAPAPLYALGGPQVFSYREILELLMRLTGRRPLLLPFPFPLWDVLAVAARLFPNPPLTEGQIALMKQDNVAPPDLPGLETLGISPTQMTSFLEQDDRTRLAGL